MSTIDHLTPRAFRNHAAQQLASSPSLRDAVVHRLLTQLSHQCHAALGAATFRFAYVPEAEPFLLVSCDPRPATICRAEHWEQLDELCWEVVLVTGICRVEIVGADLHCRCWLEATNRWIRESLP